MALLEKAILKLWDVEYSNQPQRFLHKNQGENGFTIGGIYQKYNEFGVNWSFISDILKSCDNAITRASTMLFYDKQIQEEIRIVYQTNYWHKMQLDKVNSQIVANEMFLAGVVSGNTNAVKMAQRTIGVQADGIIGNITLNALNSYDVDRFDIEYDLHEITFFENLVENKASLAIFLKGWINRSKYI